MNNLTNQRKRELRELARIKLDLPKNASIKKIVSELASDNINVNNFYSQMLKFEKANQKAVEKIKKVEYENKIKEMFRKERAEVKAHRERIKEIEKRMVVKERKLKSEQLQNVFPFHADLMTAPKEKVIKEYIPKTSTKKFKNVSEVIEFDLDGRFNNIQDIDILSKNIRYSVLEQLKQIFGKYGAFKVILSLEVDIARENLNTGIDEISPALFQSSSSRRDNNQILKMNDFSRIYSNSIEKMKNDIETYLRNGSNWQIRKFKRFFIKAVKYNSFAGSSYIELPEYIKNKKCCVNIQNNDERCFEYSVLCGLHYDEIKSNHQRVSVYSKYQKELKFDGLEMPMSVDDVEEFEKLNEIPINVFTLNNSYDPKDEVSQFYHIIYAHKIKNEKKPINLLLLEGKNNNHYCFIKNIRGFVRCVNRHSLIICDDCFRVFRLQSAYDNHKKNNKCEISERVVKCLPCPTGNNPDAHVVKFKNFKNQLQVPFVIYADIESILKPVDSIKEDVKTQIYQNHQVSHIGCKLVSEFPEILNDEYKEFSGVSCMNEFLDYIFNKKNEILELTNNKNQKVMIMTDEDKKSYNAATKCHICEGVIKYSTRDNQRYTNKVRDHCHLTGKFRGAACEKCNLDYNYKNYKLPIIFHNLKGYDSHFIMQYVGQHQDCKNISIIPTTMEKYMSFTINDCRFLDSAQFMNSSLESLVEALNKSNNENMFQHFNDGFIDETDQLKKLLRQKGIFPYDFYDKFDKINYDGLPPIEEFYNKLNECSVEKSDYLRAQLVYELNKCNNFGDYLSLYLKCDVLLLADVFEAFRKMCLQNYKLDPCHYLTSPGLSWDAMLRMTEAKIECFQEGQEDMLEMIESSMRGGISMVSNRYAKANNKYMKEYDKNIESSYIMYLDANNLYGWAMSQYLPTGNYKWENANEWNEYKIMRSKDDSKTGYIFDVDLEVPKDLHDYFNDYPLAPESRLGEYSENMKRKYRILNEKDPVSIVKKLIPNLYDKTNYVVHYRNLKLYLFLGLKLKKINRVLSFDQKPFLDKYIQFNTKQRAQCKTDFEKDFFKLMNNSVFGKTMENVSKRIEVKLMTEEKKFVKQCSMSNFKDFRIFSEGLAAVQMNKTNITYNRPMIVGFCILELSKVLMYDFHYNTMKPTYADKMKLLFTDTDSLCYHIKTEDFYEDMKGNLHMYDTSDYPIDHKCFSNENKKVIGIFKDEANSIIIIEFCGHRSKMNCLLTEGKTKATAKGIKRNQIKKLKMDEFKRVLFGETKNDLKHSVSFNLIRSSNHQLNSIRVSKTGLSAIDDKRWVLDDNIHTLALGHKNIV